MKKIMILTLLAAFLAGCATYYRVNVNGYLDKGPVARQITHATSIAVMENKNALNPIFESEVKFKIENLLRQKGYVIESPERADFQLNFAYSILPGMLATDIRPVYQPGQLAAVPVRSSSGNLRTAIITFPGYYTYLPYRYTVYTSYLGLYVIDANLLRNTQVERKVWVGEATSTDENPDLREVIDYLLIAGFERFGQDTVKSVGMTIYEKDARLRQLW